MWLDQCLGVVEPLYIAALRPPGVQSGLYRPALCALARDPAPQGRSYPPICQVLIASTGKSNIRIFNRRLSLIQSASTASVMRKSAAERRKPSARASQKPAAMHKISPSELTIVS